MESIKAWVGGVLGFVIVVGILSLFFGMIGRNDNENYQVIQAMDGDMSVRDKAGFYLRRFAKVTTYPKAVQAYYSADDKEGGDDDNSVRATFNDGGIATVSTIVRFRMPVQDEQRLLIHREFTADISNVKSSVRAHLVNCIKATATMMTSSENQTSRKAEFAKIIGDQLENGLYRFRRVEKSVLDINGQPKIDESGRTLTAFSTEIVENSDKNPIVDAESPLMQYGIDIAQFSVTSVEYDVLTRDQFAKKKEASLQAELAKIEVEKERQQTQQKIEAGKRMKAEKEAEMNVKVAESRGIAEMEVAKAEQEKLQALQIKEKALIAASQKLEVAELEKEAAMQEAQRMVALAEAKQKEIELGGFISEKEKVTLEISAKRDAMVAAEIAKLNLPDQVVMMGGGAGGNGANELFSVLGVNQAIGLMEKLRAQNTELTTP